MYLANMGSTLGFHIGTHTGVKSPLEKPNTIIKWCQLGHQLHPHLIMMTLTSLNYLLLLLTAKINLNDKPGFLSRCDGKSSFSIISVLCIQRAPRTTITAKN